jgi:hypothetical protein
VQSGNATDSNSALHARTRVTPPRSATAPLCDCATALVQGCAHAWLWCMWPCACCCCAGAALLWHRKHRVTTCATSCTIATARAYASGGPIWVPVDGGKVDAVAKPVLFELDHLSWRYPYHYIHATMFSGLYVSHPQVTPPAIQRVWIDR